MMDFFSPNANSESVRGFRRMYIYSALYACFPSECADCVALFFVMLLSFEIPSFPAVSLCFKYQSYGSSTAQ